MYNNIDYSDVLNIPDAILIDVRDNNEYLKNHLDHAINIPLNNILTVLDKYPKDAKLIIYCKSGVRSKKASLILSKLGYKNIYNLNIKSTLF